MAPDPEVGEGVDRPTRQQGKVGGIRINSSYIFALGHCSNNEKSAIGTLIFFFIFMVLLNQIYLNLAKAPGGALTVTGPPTCACLWMYQIS